MHEPKDEFDLPELPPNTSAEMPSLFDEDTHSDFLPTSTNIKPDPTSPYSFILQPNTQGEEKAETFSLNPNFIPDVKTQQAIRNQFEEAERFRLPTLLEPSDDTGYAVQESHPHSLPSKERVQDYIISVRTFIQEAKKARKIHTKAYPKLQELITQGAALCSEVFTKYAKGKFDTDALSELQSLSEQYGICAVDLAGQNAAGLKPPVSSQAINGKALENDLSACAQAFYGDVLNQFPDHKIPEGYHSEFMISKAMNQAYETCLVEIGAPLPVLVNEAQEVARFAESLHKPEDAYPKRKKKEDEEEKPPEKAPDRGALARQERYDNAMKEVASAYEIARNERRALLQQVKSSPKIYGKLKCSDDDTKVEAAQTIMKTVEHGITLMQLTKTDHPCFDPATIKQGDERTAATLALYQQKLPDTLWSLVKLIKDKPRIKNQLSVETNKVVDDLIHHRTEMETYIIRQ